MYTKSQKQEKIKNIVTGLARMKQLQREAIAKKKARKYIKTVGRVIRTGLWVVPLAMGLMNSLAQAAAAEELDSLDTEDISDEIEYLSEFDPDLLDQVNDIFQVFDGLEGLEVDEFIDSIVADINPDDLEITDIIAAEALVIEMCSTMQYS
jgi:hypothetical protein